MNRAGPLLHKTSRACLTCGAPAADPPQDGPFCHPCTMKRMEPMELTDSCGTCVTCGELTTGWCPDDRVFRCEGHPMNAMSETRSNLDAAGYSDLPLDKASLALRWERDRLRKALDQIHDTTDGEAAKIAGAALGRRAND